MKEDNFRISIIEADTGKNVGSIDINADIEAIRECVNHLDKALKKRYICIIGRCPIYESLDNKLDQIIELLKNRSKNE